MMTHLKRLLRRAATKVIWLYVAAGIIWFFLDDLLVHSFYDSGALKRVHSIESFVFLCMTTIFFSVLIRSHSRRVGAALEMAERSLAERDKMEQLLREANIKLSAVITSSPVAIVTMCTGGKVLSWNPAAEKIFGWTEGEVVGRYLPTVPNDRAGECVAHRSLILSGKSFSSVDVKRRRKDGSLVDVALSAAPIFDHAGKIIGLMGVMADTTEQKCAERALKDIQLQQKAMLDNIPDLAWMKDKESRFIMVNEAFARSCGRSAEEIIGLTDLDIWPVEWAEKYRLDDKNVMESGVKKIVEESVVSKEGHLSAIETIKTPLWGAGGDIIGTSGIARDITERKRMEEALRESEDHFRQIFQQSPIGVVIVSLDGRPLACNAAFQNLVGYLEEEIVAMRVGDLTHPDDVPAYLQLARKLLAGEIGHFQKEKRFITKSGRVVWAMVTASLITRSSGKPRHAIAMIEDITKRKEADDAINHHQEQLSSLAAELSLAEERERRKLATILHDEIGQTLAFARMKLEAATEAEVIEVSKTLTCAIEEVRSLTFQLSPPLLYEVGFRAAVEWLAETFAARHRLSVTVTEEGPQNHLPEELSVTLFQIVRELLVNIAKHSRAHTVFVALENELSGVKIRVVDDGVGFDTAPSPGKTHTFGLFSIRQRINHLGGTFHIDSKPSKGTSVLLIVPLTRGKMQSSRSISEYSPVAERSFSSF